MIFMEENGSLFNGELTSSHDSTGNTGIYSSPRGSAPSVPGLTGWRSPSNIALIKYWGKRDRQIPMNPSISISLNRSCTKTLLRFEPAARGRGKLKSFLFEGRENPSFSAKVSSYLSGVSELFPFLKDVDIIIESVNTFPHSSGIASSASAMSALALCLTSAEILLSDLQIDNDSFFKKASFTARLGSGSAARSVYPGYVLWGRTSGVPGSSDEYAIPLNDSIHDEFRYMNDSILIVDEKPKSVSSSSGHSLMKNNPWATTRYEQAAHNTIRLLEVLKSGDMDEFVKIVEKEALTLHSLMMSSDPGYILVKPGTLLIIEKIIEFRHDTGIPVCFTLDAGPNVHLIYPAAYSDKVKDLINRHLAGYCHGSKWIDDEAGTGPVEITNF